MIVPVIGVHTPEQIAALQKITGMILIIKDKKYLYLKERRK